MQDQATTNMDKPDKPTNTILWITVIYPLFITIFSLICQSKMTKVINSIPIVAESTPEPPVDHDSNSDQPLGDSEIPVECPTNLEATLSSTAAPTSRDLLSTPRLSSESSPTDPEKGHSATAAATPTIHRAQFIQATVLHLLVIAMTYRLGFLTVDYMQETKHLGVKFLTLFVMFGATIFAFCSAGEITKARSYAAQGHRDGSNKQAPLDSKDTLSSVILFSALSLVVPWIWLVIPWIKMFISFLIWLWM